MGGGNGILLGLRVAKAPLEGRPAGHRLLRAHAVVATPQKPLQSSASPLGSLHLLKLRAATPPYSPGPLTRGGDLPAGVGTGVARRCVRWEEEALTASKFALVPGSLAPGTPHPFGGGGLCWGMCADRANLAVPLPRPPATDGAATGHTVQFRMRKSWGGDTPRPGWKDRRRARRWGRRGKSDRIETLRAGKGASSGPGVPPHPAAKPSFAASRAWKGSGHRSLLIAAQRVLPSDWQLRAEPGQRGRGGAGSCNTPSRAPEARDRALPPPSRRLSALTLLLARLPL